MVYKSNYFHGKAFYINSNRVARELYCRVRTTNHLIARDRLSV